MQKQTDESAYFLARAPVSAAIGHMVVPMLLGLTANLIHTLVNSYFIGSINNTPMLAAVTLAAPFTVVFFALGGLFSTGCASYISRLLGEGKDAKGVCSASFWGSLLIGALIVAVCLPALDSIARFVGAEGETLGYTKQYLFVLILGAPFFVLNSSLIQSLRAEGAAEAALIGTLGNVALNTALDALLIPGLGLDIRGAAVAAVVSTAGSAAWFCYYAQRKSLNLSVAPRDLRLTITDIKAILKVGLSAFLLDAFQIASSIFLNNTTKGYGGWALAGLGIAKNLVRIVEIVAVGFSVGVVPLAAYAYAGGKERRLSAIIRAAFGYMLAATLALAALLFAFHKPFIARFSADDSVRAAAAEILCSLLASAGFSGCSALITGIFQALGNGAKATAFTALRGAVFIPALLLANALFGLRGTIWSLCATEVLSCAAGFLLLRKKSPPARQTARPNGCFLRPRSRGAP